MCPSSTKSRSTPNSSKVSPSSFFSLAASSLSLASSCFFARSNAFTIRIVTTGGAGGRTDPTRIEAIDLARTTQDALASKLRALLRKDYGFPREPKKKFGIDCVFSPEQVRRGASAEFCAVAGVAAEIPLDPTAGLNCAGYGSSVAVTAGFGFAAAARVLAGILAP